MSRELAPPSGWPAPVRATVGEREVALVPIAEEISRRYFERFPEDRTRYGPAGYEWAVHDTQHLLNWAAQDVAGYADLAREVRWLAGVLAARDFPMDHFWAHLELCAEVVSGSLPELAERLAVVAGAGRVDGLEGPGAGGG